MQTIFALASAAGKAGVSVIRISGPDAFAAAERLSGSLPEPRRAGLRVLRASSGEKLDEALVLCFEESASFTGEPVVELQTHGSTAIVKAVLAELSSMDGLRIAAPGEFTRRAFANGRMGLDQVEGLGDLIEAETEAQRRQALSLFSGKLGEKAEAWRTDLIRAMAFLTVTIDFADEEVPVDVTPEVLSLLSPVRAGIQAQLDGFGAAERIREGFEVAIIGAPNVGKSTLLNALAGREAAITSEIAGTTRDVIEVKLDLAGLPVTLLDTAGLRDTADKVEQIGVERAKARAEAADLRVFLVSEGDKPDLEPLETDLVFQAKADLLTDKTRAISGKTGEGLELLVSEISDALSKKTSRAGLATHERHRECLSRSLLSLDTGLELIKSDSDLTDLAAEELRNTIDSLNMLIGRVDVEHVLDDVFSSFCLGK